MPRPAARLSLVLAPLAAGLALAVGCGEEPPEVAPPAPAPPSAALRGLAFDWASLRTLADGSDNWPLTWAADGHQYTSWGDGGGFGGSDQRGRASLGVARIAGDADGFRGENVMGGVDAAEPSALDGKSYGILALGTELFLWVSPGSGRRNYEEARLHRSRDAGLHWERADWSFPAAEGIALPAFLQAGRDHAAARDGFVYVYAAELRDDRDLAIQVPGAVALLRAPRSSLFERAGYEFFAGRDASGRPRWTPDPAAREPVFRDPAGVGWTVSAVYAPELRRYLLATEHGTSFASNLGVFEAPEPWGPWATVLYENGWGRAGGVPRSVFYWNFAPRWFRDGGRAFTLVFSGIGANDRWNSVDGRFVLAE